MIYTHAAAFAIGLAVAAAGTWRVQEWRHDGIDLERIEAAQETERLRARAADSASAGHETFKERERVIYQTITETVDRIVERPVYRAACFDDDGLRQLNAAIRGTEPASREPAPAMP